MFKTFRRGGIRFLKIGRVTITISVAKSRPLPVWTINEVPMVLR